MESFNCLVTSVDLSYILCCLLYPWYSNTVIALTIHSGEKKERERVWGEGEREERKRRERREEGRERKEGRKKENIYHNVFNKLAFILDLRFIADWYFVSLWCITIIGLSLYSLLFNLLLFCFEWMNEWIYLERQRACEQGEEQRERQRERENPKQIPCLMWSLRS